MRTVPARLLTIALALGLPAAAAQDVVINEMHYEPVDPNERGEFIELYNASDVPVAVGGWFFSEGIAYELEVGVEIPAQGYLLVAEDPATITSLYGDVPVVGPWSGRLENDGETVTLRDAAGDLVDRVDYQAAFPWPIAPTGTGSSMELIHPALDNDLGGSWRASGSAGTGNPTRRYFIDARDPGWRYRKGTSNPPPDWREPEFVEDGTWQSGRTSIGYGDGDDATELADMRNGYSSVYLRRTFTIDSADDVPARLMLGVYVDDGAIVSINGREVGRFHVSPGEKDFDDLADSHEAEWEEAAVASPASLLRVGGNVVAVHALNATLDSSDLSIDVTLFVPADGEGAGGAPTPGARNSVYSENAPPQVRQVETLHRQPRAGQLNVVTAKVTDPDGVGAVELRYQTVLPGAYVPAFFPVPIPQLMANANTPRPPNPAFEDPSGWDTVAMVDDGSGADAIAADGVYTGAIPAQGNRTLVRYRITAGDLLGAAVRVPYADDPSLNFAYFVYDGVPDYFAQTSILGGPTTHSAADLTSVAVYILLTRKQDILQARAGNSADQIPQGSEARFAENWEGTFVHEGFVYDHVTYRLRGANGRYQVPPDNPGGVVGKRHWRIRFNKGNYLRARDRWGNRYPTRWKWLNTGRMFGNRLDGNWGLGDQVNDIIWNAYGVPAAFGHVFHWRVIDAADEAPSGSTGQYHGDFWGIARAFENYDVRFLEAHDLPKGNLYKLVNQTQNGVAQRRYQAPGAVGDGSDHDNIENNLRPTQSDAWLLAHVDWAEWFRYHSVAQAIRHYDYWPSANKNAAWYFYPDYTPSNRFYGLMWTLPFDADATWGPTWNQGQDRPWDAIHGGGGKPEFQKAYRAFIREVRDLLWQRDQLEQVIRQTAAFMEPLEEADIDRWRNGTAESGRQYFPASNQRSLEGKVQDMLRFAFTGGSWPGGGVGAGGRAAFLDSLADGPDSGRIPATPSATYAGEPGFPIDGLAFRSSAFSDPQGSGSFWEMRWRLAEVTRSPGPLPLSDPGWTREPVKLEIEAAWESDAITRFEPEVTIPASAVEPGKRYRVRVRHLDDTFVWSHWSPPVEFVAGPPSSPIAQVEGLRITELMYNPVGGEDFEFIELTNSGAQRLDLREVRLTDGVEFDFAEGDVTRLDSGEIVVVVRNLAAFSRRYDVSSMRIAGEYSGRLENGGEEVRLTFGRGLDILRFRYDDEWYPETDGLGRSLNIVNAALPASAWTEPQSWFASSVLHGTPGRADEDSGSPRGLLRPGDANADGSVDLSDAVAVLAILFRGPRELPCEGDVITDGGNRQVLDANGDAGVDVSDAVHLLRHLFLEGPPHALGVQCALIEGCPSACVR